MSEVRQILEEIDRTKLSIDVKQTLIEGMEQQTEVKEELDKLKCKRIFEQMMRKPLLTGTDLITFPSQPNDYLIDKLLWKGNIVFLVGQEKSSKSIFTMQQAMAMTAGHSFLGAFDVARPLNILYVQAEGELEETKERLICSTGEGGLVWNPDNWRHFYPPALALDTDLDKNGEVLPGGYTDFVNRIDADGFTPDVIFFDPLYMSMSGDLIDNKAVRDFCRNVRRIKEKYGCAIVIDHHQHRPKVDRHNNKFDEGDNAIFGSSMLKNFAAHVLHIDIVNERGNPIAKEKEKGVKYRKITCATQRNNNVVDRIMLKLTQNPLMFEIADSAIGAGSEEAVYNCIKDRGKASPCEVVDITGINRQTVYTCFTRLYKDKNKIKIVDKKGNKVFYEVVDKDLI